MTIGQKYFYLQKHKGKNTAGQKTATATVAAAVAAAARFLMSTLATSPLTYSAFLLIRGVRDVFERFEELRVCMVCRSVLANTVSYPCNHCIICFCATGRAASVLGEDLKN